MKIVALLFLFFPLLISAQDLTGTWIGHESGTAFLKLVVIQKADSCYGYTYDEGPGFCRANFTGKFDPQKQKLKGKGVSFIERSPDHVLGVYNLNYSTDGKDEYLDGTIGVKGVGSLIFSAGFAQLKKTSARVDTTRFMAEKNITHENKITGLAPPEALGETAKTREKRDIPISTNNISLPGTIANLKEKRRSKIIETIYTNADTVKMTLYDNGVVDDDTVTIFFDDAIVLNHYRISEKAKELNLPLTKNGQSHTLELFADNLGTIPPNTALVILLAGKERYEVHASYDLSSNATIVFQYKE